MERVYSAPGGPRGGHFSRVKDLEHSQQWTSLAEDIDDLERRKMRLHGGSDPRKQLLHRRSMPEPKNTSLIYVDVNTADYDADLTRPIADHYFLPIGSESNDESVDSWSWKRDADSYSSEKNYFANNNYQNYDYNRPGDYNTWGKNRRNTGGRESKEAERDSIDGEISRVVNVEPKVSYNAGRFESEETAYRGSREKLHEIFRKNRDLRREFFASIPSSEPAKGRVESSPEFKYRNNNRGEVPQDTGSGYGSVETLTSQSNNSEISAIQNRITENSSRASQNSRASEAPDNAGGRMAQEVATENRKNSNLAGVGGAIRGPDETSYYNSLGPLKSLEPRPLAGNPSKSLESPGFDGNQSPAPPLPASEPPSSIFGHRLLISGDSLAASRPSSITSNPPDPPERKKLLPQDFLPADITEQKIYKPESEGLRMLNRFEARIENLKLSPLQIPKSSNLGNSNSAPGDFGTSMKNYKSMPDLAGVGALGAPRRGMISRLAVNGSTIDLDFTDDGYPRTNVKSGDTAARDFQVSQVRTSVKPEEIRASRVDLREVSKLRNRRRRVPPPLDLSKVAEALRQEIVRQDREVLRDYSVDSTPLRPELVKCKASVIAGNKMKLLTDEESSDRPRVNAALKTATNLLDLSRSLSRPIPARVTARTAKSEEGNKETRSSGGSPRFRSSVIVWCDGNSKENDKPVVEQPRNEPRRSRLDHRKSTGSLVPATGNVFPSVYAPIPYKSPRRYVEGEVTIHYRSPVRTEAKEVLSEAELARRSAENMRRVYQEERRRKYLQELHDIDSRRHTDNFTPSQKSPIPLNRYDDFVDDLSHRSRSQEQTPEPRLVAKALYNFVGQSSRELTFRRGDIIFVRRQVDKNWYEGEHNAMIGLFPFNYVEILPYDGIRTTTTPKKPYEGQARAKFNFVAQTTHELSLVKGDLVVLTRRVDENWYEGRIGNRKGIFPISYVEVLVEPGIRPETPAQNKPVAAPAAHSLLSNGSAGGKLSMGPHHYTPSIPTNTNTAQPHYNSLPRMGGSKLHVAPVNETLHIDTHSEPLRYRALYNYRPQNDDELELKEGDAVYVMEKCDDGWFVGSSQRTGCFGTFPGNYVERL